MPYWRAMNLVTQLFAIVAVLFHVVAFVLESFLFHRPNVQTFLLGRPEPSAGVRLWAFNQGFYNLFLAVGIVAGLALVAAGSVDAGRAIVLFACACMVAAGVVLFVSSRRFIRSASIQALPPLVAIVAMLVLK